MTLDLPLCCCPLRTRQPSNIWKTSSPLPLRPPSALTMCYRRRMLRVSGQREPSGRADRLPWLASFWQPPALSAAALTPSLTAGSRRLPVRSGRWVRNSNWPVINSPTFARRSPMSAWPPHRPCQQPSKQQRRHDQMRQARKRRRRHKQSPFHQAHHLSRHRSAQCNTPRIRRPGRNTHGQCSRRPIRHPGHNTRNQRSQPGRRGAGR